MSMIEASDRRWYPDYEDQWDARAFRERVLELVRPEMRMLDIGATQFMHFKGLLGELIGTDVDL